MKKFEKWRKQQEVEGEEVGFDYANGVGWRAALEMANKLFLDGMHPQDVIFAIQKELEDK